MKILKLLAMLCVIATMSVGLAACSDDDDENPKKEEEGNAEQELVGSWEDEYGEFTFTFKNDGTYLYEEKGSTDSGKYIYKDSKLTLVNEEGEKEEYRVIKVTAKILELKDSDGEEILLNKVKAGNSDDKNEGDEENKDDENVGDDGNKDDENVGDDGNKDDENVGSETPNIIGTWDGIEFTLILKDNETYVWKEGNVSVEEGTYTYKNSTLTLIDEDGDISEVFEIISLTSTILTVWDEYGDKLELKKVEESSGSDKNNSIVGVWDDGELRFTFNNDGSFEELEIEDDKSFTGSYTYQGSTLKLKYDYGDTAEFSITINGSTLKMTDEWDDTYTYQKK